MILLILGWIILPGSPWYWTALALATLSVPLFQFLIRGIVDGIRNRSLAALNNGDGGGLPLLGQVSLDLTFLAHRAVLSLDAIARTLVRLFLTRRNLLEWETAASAEQRLKSGVLQFLSSMWPAPVMAIAIGVLVIICRPERRPVCGTISGCLVSCRRP